MSSAQSRKTSQRPRAAMSSTSSSSCGQMSPYPATRPSASSTRNQSRSNSALSSHDLISSASTWRDSPKHSTNSRATASSSPARSSLRGDELIERLRQREQVGQLALRLRVVGRGLAEPVHPHAAQPELVARLDVVEERSSDVHVALSRRTRAGEKLLPVLVTRLVRADLLRDDDLVEDDPHLHL